MRTDLVAPRQPREPLTQPLPGVPVRGVKKMIAIASNKKKPTKPAAAQLPDDEAEEARYKPIDRALVRRLLTLLAPFKLQYTLGLSLGLAHVALEMLSPRYMQEII